MSTVTTLGEIKNASSRVFRRAYIKRMQLDGTFESDWTEVTDDVKKWGRITRSIDAERFNKFKFSGMNLVFNNQDGLYNPESSQNSLWYNFAGQQRTLVKIEAGFVRKTFDTTTKLWSDIERPAAKWDSDCWDLSLWDDNPVMYRGIISGDIFLSDKNEVSIPVVPVSEIFRLFPARDLTGFTSTGITASQYCEILRDQTDGAGNLVFRPFFDNTTTNFDINTTTSVYSELDSSGSEDIINLSAFDVLQKLSEAENYVNYISIDGKFTFKSRAVSSTSAAYEFYGLGFNDTKYGHTIKSISQFGPRHTKYYSRVKVQHDSAATNTSYEIVESTLTVNGTNKPWAFGHRTLNINNTWLDSATAATLATTVFNNVSALKREVTFKTSFIPAVDVLNIVKVNYDPSIANSNSLWDFNNWAATTGAAANAADLIWDSSRGDSFNLLDEEMFVLSVSIDLDKLENQFILRET